MLTLIILLCQSALGMLDMICFFQLAVFSNKHFVEIDAEKSDLYFNVCLFIRCDIGVSIVCHVV